MTCFLNIASGDFLQVADTKPFELYNSNTANTVYDKSLIDDGYDDVEFLCEMRDGKIETILTEAGMAKVGHRKRFVSCVRKLRAAAA